MSRLRETKTICASLPYRALPDEQTNLDDIAT